MSAAVCGLPLASSDTSSVPILAPAAVGVKVTEILQVPETARVAPQVLVSAKSPLAVIDEIFSAPVPGLVRVMVCAALVEPTVCVPKVRLAGESDAPGAVATPVPDKLTV